jgi:hypothetical protein
MTISPSKQKARESGRRTKVGQVFLGLMAARPRCTTDSWIASKDADEMQAQLDLRLWLRLIDQVAK